MALQMSPVYGAGVGGGNVNRIAPQPQTVVIMSNAPLKPINRRADGSRIGFADRWARYCGITQNVCGFILLIIGILMISSGAMFTEIGYAWWGGVLCFVAGGIGLHGAKKKNDCAIIGTMVVSIFTCLFGFVLVGISAAGIAIDEQQRRCLEESAQMKFHPPSCDTAMPARSISQVNFRIACHVGNILVGIVLMVVPIFQSCLSCRAICCPTTDACLPQHTSTSVCRTHPQQQQQQQPLSIQQQQVALYTSRPYGQHVQHYDQLAANQPLGVQTNVVLYD
ncbi:uncharacterized protein LOC141912465 [Tubulanus polymorphus]|uniref:uncharacterized protein LOC141912465 n=1 Tax=Tubulanus polymorphus TaxID=672921 RepID=UPI003DA49A18